MNNGKLITHGEELYITKIVLKERVPTLYLMDERGRWTNKGELPIHSDFDYAVSRLKMPFIYVCGLLGLNPDTYMVKGNYNSLANIRLSIGQIVFKEDSDDRWVIRVKADMATNGNQVMSVQSPYFGESDIDPSIPMQTSLRDVINGILREAELYLRENKSGNDEQQALPKEVEGL